MFQSNNLIMLYTILTAVVAVGVIFIRHALRHRKNINNSKDDVSKNKTSVSDLQPFPTMDAKQNTEKNFYLLRFICNQEEFTEPGNSIRIRPKYHQLIRKITGILGNNKLTIKGYVDNVLKAHFEEQQENIKTLYNEHQEYLFKTDE